MAKKKRRRGANGLPWYRAERDCWCVPGDPKKAPIRDRHGEIVRGAENGDRAKAVWHEMMSLTHAGRAGDENDVRTVLEGYLQRHVERHATPKTLDDYSRWFKSFVSRWPGLQVRDMSSDHVERWWAERHPKWGSSMRNLVGSAFKAAFAWAAAADGRKPLIPHSPLNGWKLPTMRKRSAKVVVSGADFGKVLAEVGNQRVRDVLEVLWATATRPINLARATAAHISPDGYALVYDEHNTPEGASVHKTFKRTGQALIISLPEKAREIVLRLAKEHPTGPLFRSPRGNPWTASLLANTIRNHATKVGLKGKFVAYSARHSMATELLTAGRTAGEVAGALGNTAKVVERSYSHVTAERVRRQREMLEHRS